MVASDAALVLAQAAANRQQLMSSADRIGGRVISLLKVWKDRSGPILTRFERGSSYGNVAPGSTVSESPIDPNCHSPPPAGVVRHLAETSERALSNVMYGGYALLQKARFCPTGRQSIISGL